MTAPKPPSDFSKPEPRKYYIRPDKTGEIASIAVGGFLRLGSGAFVEGYRVGRDQGKLMEYSASLPKTRPALPLHLFEFEACPFCRKVREVVTLLDLDVVFFPCPKGGLVYREIVKSRGGKAQFPYLEDPNTDFCAFESADIIRYLYSTYGPRDRAPSNLSMASTISAGLASAVRSGKGRNRTNACVPAKYPVEVWAYEASPFCKLVRETLNELEMAHIYHSAGRGSPARKDFEDRFGRFQVPYIIDHNTGVSMWESAEICEYLVSTYGASAPGAVEVPAEGSVFLPGDPLRPLERDDGLVGVGVTQDVPDAALEEYCEDNPEAGECREYDG